LHGRHRHLAPAAGAVDQGLPHNGLPDAGAVLHHHDQDDARQPRERQAGQPDRGRQGRAPADGSRARLKGCVTNETAGGGRAIPRRSRLINYGREQLETQHSWGTAMQRVLVFLVGPLLVTAWLAKGLPSGPDAGLAFGLVVMASILTWIVSIIVGLIDGCLALIMPISQRFLGTATVGAIVTWGLV